MFERFFKKNTINPLLTDVHSHLIPSVDDGVKSLDESLRIIDHFSQLGYKKIITTPHIYPEFYPNIESDLTTRHADLREAVLKQGIEVQIELAAEYFADEILLARIKNKESLLTFGDRYVLLETGFHFKPLIWNEIVFELQIQQYRPILAHPERYIYLIEDPKQLEDYKDAGVLLQLSLPSLVGAYGPASQQLSKKMIKNGFVDLVGSDVHNPSQMQLIEKAMKTKLYRQLMQQVLINNEL